MVLGFGGKVPVVSGFVKITNNVGVEGKAPIVSGFV